MTALALAGKGIPYIQYGMKVHFGGSVASADFHPPGGVLINEEIIRALGAGWAFLLKNHGGLTVGKSLAQAFENMIYLEELSASYIHALLLGTVSPIN